MQKEIAIIKDVARTCPNPIMRFEDGNFPDYIMSEIRKAGYSAPTPIQAQGWSLALTGQDMVGIAQTGSGKTFTITGGAERYADRGIIPRTLSYIFQHIREHTTHKFKVNISYLEIYN